MVAASNQVSHVASKLVRANESPASVLTLIGVNYRTAPLALRERLAFTETLLPAALHFVTEMASVAYILSTCNRTELYAVTPVDNPVAVLTEMLATIRGIPRDELSGHTYMRSGEGSVRHLLRVASGLDSMVLGEAQILGQVRDAYEVAMT